MAVTPSDSQIKKKIRDLIPKIDLQTTGVKQFIKALSNELGVDLKPRKDFIKTALAEAIQETHNHESEEEESDHGSEQDETDEDDDNEVPTNKKSVVAKRRASGGGGGGLSERKEISTKLEKFLGQGNVMARTEIVKSLWEYIREHNLQNPNNKREIILDDAMREVFGCHKFTMFTMNKYVGAHIHPFKPVDLTSNSTPKKPKASKRKVKGQKGKEKKKRKAGSQPPYRLSEELQAVVKEAILPRPQVVSKIWTYIKSNNLQNEKNKREILCDAKLKAIMKKSKVTMFEMNSLISKHLIEKVDKSEYHHKEDEDVKEEEEEESEEEECEEEDDEEESD